MTNKIDTFLKSINDRMTRALPSDTVKNPKLNDNPISSALSIRSYPMEDPQSSSNPFKSVNAIKTCFKSTNNFRKDHLQAKTLTVNEVEIPKSEEPEKALEDEFKDLHIILPVLEVLAHVPNYDAFLDKYVESLELGKSGFAFIQGEMPKKMKDPGLFILPCRLGDSKPFDTLADLRSWLADGTTSYHVGIVRNVEVYVGKLKLLNDFYVIDMEKDPICPLLVGRGFLATASAVIDCKKAKIAVGEGVTRDAELNPSKDVLVFRTMVEFLGTIPINLKENMWETKELIKKKIDWNKPSKEGDENYSKKRIQAISSTWSVFVISRSVTPSLATRLVKKQKSLLEDPQCSTHIHGLINAITIHPKQQNDSRDSMVEEEQLEREGDHEDTNTIAYIKEQKDTPLLERKDIFAVDNLGPNKDDEGVEWLDVEEPLDLVDINETKEITFKTSYKEPERSKLSSEGHDLLSSGVILSKDDYDRGCRKPSDLEEGLYRDTIKLGPKYVIGMDDEGEVT
nr:hypothetical protein [Tanacetum cinerariifolium]